MSPPSSLLAPHPLQVHAGRDELQPLLVTMTDGKSLHARWLHSTCRAAPHAVRARRAALLHRQVGEFSSKASIFAVLRTKLLNLFQTNFSSSPNALLTDLVSPGNQVSTMAPDANWRLLNNAGRRRSAALVPGRNCTNIDGDRDGATAPEPLSGVQGEGGLLPPSRAIGRLLSLRSSLDIHQRSGAGGGRRVSRLRSEADP